MILSSSSSEEVVESSSSTSISIPLEVGVETSNPVQEKDTELENPNLVRRKDLQVREALRWQVDGAQEEFYKGLEPVPIKRAIFEEYQIITALQEYPKLEQRFDEYEFAWMSKPLGSYQPNLVREFFANYLALLKKDCPKGSSVADKNKWEIVPVRGVILIFQSKL